MKARFHIAPVLLLITLLTCLSAMRVQADNLFPKGSFEEATLAAGIPDGWEPGDASPDDCVIIAENPSPAMGSTNSLMINPGPGLFKIKSPLVPIDPGKPLNISIWVKGPADSPDTRIVRVRVEWFDEGGNLVEWEADRLRTSVYLGSNNRPEWKLLEREFPPQGSETHPAILIPSNAASCQISILAELSEAPAFIDDLILRQWQ